MIIRLRRASLKACASSSLPAAASRTHIRSSARRRPRPRGRSANSLEQQEDCGRQGDRAEDRRETHAEGHALLPLVAIEIESRGEVSEKPLMIFRDRAALRVVERHHTVLLKDGELRIECADTIQAGLRCLEVHHGNCMDNLASDLEALLEGALTVEDFRSRYQSGPTSTVVDAIRGNLEHYLADADIRASDPEYRTMQNGELLNLIGLLREDAPIVELRRVNFLGRASREREESLADAGVSPKTVDFLKQLGHDAIEECERANRGAPITLIEVTTAAAFLTFARTPADIVLLEVGVGGLLDSTNVIRHPAVIAITPVSLDHQDEIGDTVTAIAGEKAGIIKSGAPAVIAPQPPDAAAVIEACAAAVSAPL